MRNEEFVRYLGVDYEKKGNYIRIVCPFHADSHPSLLIYPEIERGSYCFAAETEVMTDSGIKKIGDIVNKEVCVLNGNGKWERTIFRSYGVQRLRKITLSRNSFSRAIYATPEHQWFKKDVDTPLTTDQLKSGDMLEKCISREKLARFNRNSNHFKNGVMHGAIFGDGSISKQYKSGRYLFRMSIYSKIKVPITKYFNSVSEGDKVRYATCYHASDMNMKAFDALGDLSKWSKVYLAGFLAGYLATDGCVKRGRAVIHSTVKENLMLVRDICCVLGIPTGEICYQDRVSNLTNEIGRVYKISIMPKNEHDWLFIRPDQKQEIADRADWGRIRWKVVSVEETDRVEEVYCCQTSTQSFVLSGNLLTHNCFACATACSWAWLAVKIKGIPYKQALEELGQEVLPPSAVKNTITPPPAMSFCGAPKDRIVEAFTAKHEKCSTEYPEKMKLWLEGKKLLDVARVLDWRWNSAVASNFKFWGDGIVIPYKVGSQVVYERYRALNKATGRFEKPKGPIDVPIQPYFTTFRPNNVVMIAEGESDSASLYAHGASAIGVPGAVARKAINTAVAFICDHSVKNGGYIDTVCACGDKDESGRKMNQLIRQAVMDICSGVRVIEYTPESADQKADINDDHVAGLLKIPVQWTASYGENYDRQPWANKDFGQFCDKCSAFLEKKEEAKRVCDALNSQLESYMDNFEQSIFNKGKNVLEDEKCIALMKAAEEAEDAYNSLKMG